MTTNEYATPTDPEAPLGFQEHDHALCVEHTLAAAETRCAEEGLRLTPVRRKVLELLLQEHRALGALIYFTLNSVGDN